MRWAFGDKKKQEKQAELFEIPLQRIRQLGPVDASYGLGMETAKSHQSNPANSNIMGGLVRSAVQFSQQFEKNRMFKRLLHSRVSAGAATNDRSTLLHYTVYRNCMKNAQALIARYCTFAVI
jgi:hypothetical protein